MALAGHLDEFGPDAINILDKNDIKANELTVNVRREISIMKALNHKISSTCARSFLQKANYTLSWTSFAAESSSR
jgi:hypothetical protein